MERFLYFITDFFSTKKIVITSNGRKKRITIHWFAQVLLLIVLIFIIYAFSIFCGRYIKYKNYNNYAVIINENDNLKKEHKEIRKELVKQIRHADKVNEYLSNDSNFLSLEHNVGKSFVSNDTSIGSMMAILREKRIFTYQKLDERKKIIGRFVKKVGISSIMYNSKSKVASISSDAINGNIYSVVSNVTDELGIGGNNENVKNIKITNNNNSFLKISKEKITDDNYAREIKKMIEIEKNIKYLPFGVPAKSRFRLTSTYGFRKDPIRKHSKELKLHRGLDIVISDRNVSASKEGVVKFAGEKGGYGKCIDIEHSYKNNTSNNSFVTRYAHLSKIFVQKGQYVNGGDVIGLQGSSGRATGSHVHYEVRINDHPVNPINFLKLKLV